MLKQDDALSLTHFNFHKYKYYVIREMLHTQAELELNIIKWGMLDNIYICEDIFLGDNMIIIKHKISITSVNTYVYKWPNIYRVLRVYITSSMVKNTILQDGCRSVV